MQMTVQSGYQLHQENISFDRIGLKWGSYNCPEETTLSFHPDKTVVVSHFQLSDPSKNEKLKERQFAVHWETAGSYDLTVAPTENKTRLFFELSMADHFFQDLVTEDSGFLTRFHDRRTVNAPALAYTASMAPAMYDVIRDMQQTPYKGRLKEIYLEAKAIELFLMQVGQLDREGGQSGRLSKLKPGDIDRLHAIKEYITLNFHQPFTIISLARQAGINQMKLKEGFKELFETTIFGYLHEIRMKEAKRLLVDERLYVGEVADRIGYKHPHHFTAAFKRKFGVLPRDLLSSTAH
jgi:AraC-like DNA-binding protein